MDTLFSCRILYGSFRVRGYDWIPGGKPSTAMGDPKPARLAIHKDIEARLHASNAVDEPVQNIHISCITSSSVECSTVCHQEGDPPIVIRPSSGGNIHSFIAKSSCAILDLLAPPYDLSHPGKQFMSSRLGWHVSFLKDCGREPALLLQTRVAPTTRRPLKCKQMAPSCWRWVTQIIPSVMELRQPHPAHAGRLQCYPAVQKMPDPDDITFENKSYSGIQVE